MYHHEQQRVVKRLFCYHQHQGHSEDSYNQNIIISAMSWELLTLLQPSRVWWCIIISWCILWKKQHCSVQEHGDSDGSKLDWMFVSPVFSVPLIFLQPNWVCGYTVSNNQTWCKKSGFVYVTVTITDFQYLSISGVFCHAWWQTLCWLGLSSSYSLGILSSDRVHSVCSHKIMFTQYVLIRSSSLCIYS